MPDSTQKIALCISSFRAGGGERVMVAVANALAARGRQVDLLVLKPVGPYAEHVDSRVRVISLDARRMIFSLPKFVSYLKRERPSVVMALDEYTHILSLAARKLSGSDTRIILRIGNMFTELFKRYEGMKGRVLEFLVRRWYRHADAVIANSQGVRDDIVQVTGISPEKVSVIFNPKDIAALTAQAALPVGHAWLERKTLPVVIASGRLREQKNLPVLIRAFDTLRASTPARLIILGAGREEERLRDLVRALHLEDAVSFPGYMDNPYAWLAKADVFVSVSLWEGLPNTVIEALACGLPVIASDCDSGPREILAPDTDYRKRITQGSEPALYGVLTAVNDEAALAEALKKLLSDAPLRAQYAAAAVKRSHDFEDASLIPQYEQVLDPA